MNINFLPLAESHFPLLLKWLETPHVKKWWDQDVHWTLELVQEKYGDYIKGYKLVHGVAKSINAYIICVDEKPIGYIQIYNFYDFFREKPLSSLPESLAAFDVLIGESDYLKRGIGSKAITIFLDQYAISYSYVFVDTESANIAAIRAYEKAGFKKTEHQPDTNEVWMIRQQMKRPDPLKTIQKLIEERYSDAKAIFWAGSISQEQGTSASDLDLVIVFDSIPNAYREAFIYDDWPIDAFIHDPDTLRFFFEESRAVNGISGLSYMILNGREILAPNDFSKSIKMLAQEMLKSGPAIWDKETIDKERFLITDTLDDIKFPTSRDEQIASAAWLLEALGQFYFRAQNKWCASGKSIIRYLKDDNPTLALEFNQCFENLFQKGDVIGLEAVVKKILMPYGGLFWDGFKSHASRKAKLSEEYTQTFDRSNSKIENVVSDLKKREPIFHHPAEFGITKKDILNMTCDEFWEVGASGNRYSREYVIEVLLDRYSDPEYEDIWETKDFKCQEIAYNNYLLTYTLLQGKRETKRSTIWRRTSSGWKIFYHQGTVVQETGDEHKE